MTTKREDGLLFPQAQSRLLADGTKPVPTTNKSLRVLIVDDNRHGAYALGLVVGQFWPIH